MPTRPDYFPVFGDTPDSLADPGADPLGDAIARAVTDADFTLCICHSNGEPDCDGCYHPVADCDALHSFFGKPLPDRPASAR
jgi:hypothetical protein